MTRFTSRARLLVVPALALVLAAAGCSSSGSSASAKKSGSTTGAKLAAATVNGDGSTFQAAYDTEVIAQFKRVQPDVTVNYPPTNSGGSGKGQTDLQGQVVQFAGSDVVPPTADLSKYKGGALLYFPTVAGPITLSYNVSGVDKLQLSADSIAGIFSGKITKWNDPAIKADNPGASLPSATIATEHRADSSGTTANFTEFLVKAAPTAWTLGSNKALTFPNGSAGQGNGGVASNIKSTPNSIGYVDFSDAKAAGLTFASVKNAAGKFIEPSTASASAAVAGATVNPNLSYDPINSTGSDAYPITSPTYILVYKTQTDKAVGEALRSFLSFLYGKGQQIAPTVDFAPLSSDLVTKAKAQLDTLVVPSS